MTEPVVAGLTFLALWLVVFLSRYEADREMMCKAGLRLTWWHVRRIARDAFFAALVVGFLAWAVAFVIMRGLGR